MSKIFNKLKKGTLFSCSCLFNKIKESLSIIKNKENKIDISLLTSKEIEEELKRETYKSKYFRLLKSTIYALIIIGAFSSLLATFFMPVLQISTVSMAPKYNTGDYVISIKTKNLQRGDVIAFYHGNKILVKRVIAKSGEWVLIDEDGNVYVDGVKLQEPYLTNKVLGEYDIKFPYQVPDGQWFVLSDVRAESIDSRNSNIGCISGEDIIGKILFKLWNSN